MTPSEPFLRAVAIDGPAGAGKSTVARGVARDLGYLYVDTGAMYRAMALAALRAGVDLEDADAVARVAERAADQLEFDASGTRLFLAGEDVSTVIRTAESTARTKFAARVPAVRQRLAERQRAMAAQRPVVMEGRDIGLAVLPDARWKYFLTASPEARAERRWHEMRAAGSDVAREDVLAQQAERDAADDQVGPLKILRERALAGDGVEFFDTTGLTPDQVVERIVRRVRQEDSAR